MNQVTLGLKNSRIRLIFTIFWLVIALFISAAFDYGKPLAAQAKPLTQEVIAYQFNSNNVENAQEQDGLPHKDLIERSRQQLKSRADDIRENMNLDKPVFPNTKDSFDTVQNRDKEAVKETQHVLEKAVNTISK